MATGSREDEWCIGFLIPDSEGAGGALYDVVFPSPQRSKSQNRSRNRPVRGYSGISWDTLSPRTSATSAIQCVQ